MRASDMLKRGPPDAPEVFLTFDDGPDPDWTPRVLDLLAQAGAVAAFFVVGCSARAHPRLVRRIVEAGHELGNHTLTHAHPWTLSRENAMREVREGAAAIEDAAASRCAWFRPPHGRVRRCMVEQATAQGERTVLWSRSAIDWGPLASHTAVARRMQGVEPGDILLMHDAVRGPNRPAASFAALAPLLAELPRRRLRPARLSRLAG